MIDIVARLRSMLACDPGCEGRCYDCLSTVAKEAADEIEWLRKEVAGAMILADMLRDSSLGHQERAAIFRQALRDISNATMSQFVRASDLADYQREIARAALAKEFDDE